MPECIFCQIVAGQAPASFVHRDALCAAFMDIQPVNPGHELLGAVDQRTPIAHAANLAELDEDTGAHLARVLQRLAPAVRQSGVRCEGIDLFLADGEAAGQEVFHVHWHIIPRFTGDGFGFRFGPEYANLPPRAELDRIAANVRGAATENPWPAA